jgi:ATP-binding cassette subfamily B protein
MMSFLMFSMLLINIPRAGVSARRINEVLDTEIVIKDPDNPAVNLNDAFGHVRFEDVTFTFPDSKVPTLQNITFEAKPGQVTAIIGSTGSGKSSIINLIPRFYDISEGHILVDNIDVRDYAQKDLRDKIGFVPQQALLFSGTIRDNMRFGKPDSTDDDIKVALEVAQAARFVAKKENGYDAEVSQGGKNFSGGQKQRIAIARALIKKPEIFIFDDSFSALDFKTDIRLRTALKEYTKNASVIIVAQRVSSIMDADNILVLNEGRIVGQGKHQSLLKSCKVYQEIVFSQMDESEIKRTLEIKKQVLLAEGGDE